MSNRSGKLFGKFLPVILVTSLVGGTLAIALQDTARADDTCLSGPKATTPQGSHWYYRVEPGTKRHCWYLGEERGKTAQAATAKPSSPAAAPDKPSQTSAAATPLQPSVANARAEFMGVTSASEREAVTSPPPDAASANGDAQTADTSKSNVTTRWPDPAISTAQPQPAPAAPATEPTSQLLGERTEPGPAVRVVSAPVPQASSYSMPMLLGGLAGALAFAGLLGFAVVKFGSLNRLRHFRHRPESIWDVVDTGQPPPWQPRDVDLAPTPDGNPLRTRREIEAQSRDIMEILSRASRETAT